MRTRTLCQPLGSTQSGLFCVSAWWQVAITAAPPGTTSGPSPSRCWGSGGGILALLFTVCAFKSQSFYVCSPFFLDLILMCWHLGIEHLLGGCRPVFGCPVGNKCAVCA